MDRYHCVTPDISSTASSHECTGLMPRPPITQAEYEAYQELYGMEIPKRE